jgi:hypothetical protein
VTATLRRWPARATRAPVVLAACLALAAATAGCPPTSLEDPGRFDVGGGSASGGDMGGSDLDGGGAAVTLGEGGVCPDVPQFFAATCTASSCHNASDEAQGLDLQSPDVASRLVSVMATEGSGLLIDPSAPNASILYLKLTATPPFGAQMPLGQKPLPGAMAACVLDWIESGEEARGSPVSADGGAASDATVSLTEAAEAGMSCETTMDANGFMRCSCLAGTAPSANAVASCTGYDCCVRYGADSGLMEGFGNPGLSSNLCACYSSADIAAIYGASVTCQRFTAGGGAAIVKSCP